MIFETSSSKDIPLLQFKHIVGNEAEGRISKRVFLEDRACQILRITNIFYPLIRTRTCVYQGVKNVCPSDNLTCFVSLKHPLWDSPFCPITDELNVSFWIILSQIEHIISAFTFILALLCYKILISNPV